MTTHDALANWRVLVLLGRENALRRISAFTRLTTRRAWEMSKLEKVVNTFLLKPQFEATIAIEGRYVLSKQVTN